MFENRRRKPYRLLDAHSGSKRGIVASSLEDIRERCKTLFGYFDDQDLTILLEDKTVVKNEKVLQDLPSHACLIVQAGDSSNGSKVPMKRSFEGERDIPSLQSNSMNPNKKRKPNSVHERIYAGLNGSVPPPPRRLLESETAGHGDLDGNSSSNVTIFRLQDPECVLSMPEVSEILRAFTPDKEEAVDEAKINQNATYIYSVNQHKGGPNRTIEFPSEMQMWVWQRVGASALSGVRRFHFRHRGFPNLKRSISYLEEKPTLILSQFYAETNDSQQQQQINKVRTEAKGIRGRPTSKRGPSGDARLSKTSKTYTNHEAKTLTKTEPNSPTRGASAEAEGVEDSEAAQSADDPEVSENIESEATVNKSEQFFEEMDIINHSLDGPEDGDEHIKGEAEVVVSTLEVEESIGIDEDTS